MIHVLVNVKQEDSIGKWKKVFDFKSEINKSWR